MITGMLAEISSARAERLRSLSRQFQEPEGDLYLRIGMTLAGILAIFVLMRRDVLQVAEAAG